MMITAFRAVSPYGDIVRLVSRPHAVRHQYAVIVGDEGREKRTFFQPHSDRGHAVRAFLRQCELIRAEMTWPIQAARFV